MHYTGLNLDPLWLLPSRLETNGVYEQGDTCANTFTLLYCALHSNVDAGLVNGPRSLELLTSADGWPRRSPDLSKWHGRAGRCSRDQLTPYLAYVAIGPDKAFYSLLWALLKHGMIFANNTRRNFVYDSLAEHRALSTPDVPYRPGWKIPDLLGPDVWQIVARGMALRGPGWARFLAYLPLMVLDLQGLGSALLVHCRSRKLPSDERNQALKTHFAATYLPTIVSKLSYRIYASTQPIKAFNSFWTQPGEPAIHKCIAELYK